MALKLLNVFYWITPSFLKKPFKIFYSIMMKWLTPPILQKFRRETKKIFNLYDAIDFAFSFQYFIFSIKPRQVKCEITKLLEIVKDLKPKLILEIGTAGGGTLFLFTSTADPEATIISVDLPGGSFGGGYPEWKILLYQSFAKGEQKIKLLRADSHNPKILELIKTAIDHRMIDFLFIDGDHTYEGVKRDFNMYSSLVKEGGIIALHDIVPGPPENVGGVPLLWKEIKKKYRHIELVSDWKQGGCGIGVIYP